MVEHLANLHLVAVFRSEQRDDPDDDLGGVILLPEQELVADSGMTVLPFDESDLAR